MKILEEDIKWREFKQGVRSLWRLSDAEIEASGRDTYKLEKIIINKFTHDNPVIIHQQMQELIASFDNPSDHHPHKLYQTSFERRPPGASELNP